MEYLKQALDINVTYSPWPKQNTLPYLLSDRYNFQIANLDTTNALFVYPKDDIESIPAIKKHVALIAKYTSIPIVLILNKCDARDRKELITNKISFIVENQQIYLPFMSILLQERFSSYATRLDALLPSAELLLFYYIYSKKRELEMSQLSNRLELSAMSISRATKQLEELGLIKTYKNGVNKIITSELYGEELYRKAENCLRSPVKKVGYIEKGIIKDGYKAGISALAEYSMLNYPKVNTIATLKAPKELEQSLVNEEAELCVEVWSYNPALLANNGVVDVLSLHQSLKGESDERVESAVEQLLESFWGDYYDSGIRKF